MSTEFDDPIVAYMAVKFKGIDTNSGWLYTTWGKSIAATVNNPGSRNPAGLLPVDGTGNTPTNGPPHIQAYAPLTTMQWSVRREYAVGSFGGARTAVRPSLSDVFVQRSVDEISPYFMEYASNGAQLANAQIVYRVRAPESPSTTAAASTPSFETVSWIQMTNVLVTGYYYDTKAEAGEDGEPDKVSHYETLTLNYSSIVFTSHTTSKSWSKHSDTGS